MTEFLIYFFLACIFSGFSGWMFSEAREHGGAAPWTLFGLNVFASLTNLVVALTYLGQA